MMTAVGRGQLVGLAALAGAAAAAFVVSGCGRSAPPVAPEQDPRFQSVLQGAPSSLSAVLPEHDDERPLEAARGRVMGVDVPTAFVMRRRDRGEALGEVYTRAQHLEAFYARLGYKVARVEDGLRVVPSERVLSRLPDGERALAAHSRLTAYLDRDRWWAIRIRNSAERAPGER